MTPMARPIGPASIAMLRPTLPPATTPMDTEIEIVPELADVLRLLGYFEP